MTDKLLYRCMGYPVFSHSHVHAVGAALMTTFLFYSQLRLEQLLDISIILTLVYCFDLKCANQKEHVKVTGPLAMNSSVDIME